MFKKIFTTFIAVLLIVALAVGMVACDSGSKKKDKDDDEETREPVDPSAEAFRDAYKEAIGSLKNGVDKYYALADEFSLQDLGMNSAVSLAISNELSNLLSSLLQGETGVDFDLTAINDFKFSTNYNFKGDKVSASTAISYKNSAVMSAEYIIDIAAGVLYVAIPEMNSTYLKTDLEELDADMDEIMEILKVLTSLDFVEMLPDKSTVNGLIDDITGAIIDSIDGITFKRSSITANGLSQECVAYTVEISTNDIINIATNLIAVLKNNQNLKTLIEDMLSTSADVAGKLNLPVEEIGLPEASDIIARLNAMLDEASTAIGNYSSMLPDTKLATWTSYITDYLEILGTKIEVNFSDLQNLGVAMDGSAVVYIATATSDNATGVEMYANISGTKFGEIIGTLEKNSKKLSGELFVYVKGQNCGCIELENVDTKSERFVGAITISPSSTLLNQYLPTTAIMGITIANPGIKINVTKNDGKNIAATVSVMNNGSEFVSFNVEAGYGSAKNVTIPSNTTTDEDSWSSSFSVDKLIQIAKSKNLPADLIKLLEMAK